LWPILLRWLTVISFVSTYSGVDQTTPVGTAVTAQSAGVGTTTATVNASSAASELVVDGMITRQGQTITAGANQTDRGNVTDSANWVAGISEEAGAGTVTMSWTLGSDNLWAIVAVPLKPAAAPTSSPMFRGS
jgi:hypothetical protein